jgi:hypothetical protein
MPDFLYSGEDRVYHDFGEVTDGDVRELDEAPDYRWTEITNKEAE